MIDHADNLTLFQTQCISDVSSLLDGVPYPYSLRVMEGEDETYVVAKVDRGQGESRFEIYIYSDEAGYYLGDQWYIWELPDYSDLTELADDFLESVKITLESSLP